MLIETSYLLIGLFLVPFLTTLLAPNRRILMVISMIWVVMMLGFVVAGPFDEQTTLALLPMVALGAAVSFAIKRYTLTKEGRHKRRFSLGLMIFAGLFVPALVLTAPYWIAFVE